MALLDLVIKEYEELLKKYPRAVYSLNPSDNRDPETLISVLQRKQELPMIDDRLAKESFFNFWAQSQVEFSNQSKELRNQLLENWMCCEHRIPIKRYNSKTDSLVDSFLKVSQFFLYPFTPEGEYDDEFFSTLAKRRKNNSEYYSLSRKYYNAVFDQIIKFVVQLRDQYKNDKRNFFVVLANSGLDNPKEFNNYHFRHFQTILRENGIIDQTEDINIDLSNQSLAYGTRARLVVVDLITTNDSLLNNCKHLFNDHIFCWYEDEGYKESYPYGCFTDIVYISLRKELSPIEMGDLISLRQQRVDEEIQLAEKKREEEERRKSEELKHKRESEKQEQIRKEIKEHLIQSTKNWSLVNGVLRAFSMFNYYPTTCDLEITDKDWEIRNLVWDFKAAPNKPEPLSITTFKHKMAEERIVPALCRCLRLFFGENLKYITFTCIPASSKIKTERRFKDFCEKICSELGMINAYPYINVTADGTAKHLGGSEQASFSIDHGFFKGKMVLMFDDIITKGGTMNRFKRLLEEAGATVIGGISIGKTKHERSANPIDIIDQFIYNQNNSSQYFGDDLPF